MIEKSGNSSQIQQVNSFEQFLSADFSGLKNAICWKRELRGDFAEIVEKLEDEENIVEISPEELLSLELSEQGKIAREILLSDLKALKDFGASPVLNIIRNYERDDFFFPTDVYSFHVDRSSVPTATILCTYYGAASEIIPNDQCEQKILIPEIREKLRKLYVGPEDGFDDFLTENFFDLHYKPKPNAEITNLGIGNIWKLACDHPGNPVLPCVHRAPEEKDGKPRLLLIC